MDLSKIIVALSGVLVGSWVFFGFFVKRMVKGYDDQIKDLYSKTQDLPAIREAIKWLKEDKK